MAGSSCSRRPASGGASSSASRSAWGRARSPGCASGSRRRAGSRSRWGWSSPASRACGARAGRPRRARAPRGRRSSPEPGAVLAVIDARRGEVFAAAYARAATEARCELTAPRALAPGGWRAAARTPGGGRPSRARSRRSATARVRYRAALEAAGATVPSGEPRAAPGAASAICAAGSARDRRGQARGRGARLPAPARRGASLGAPPPTGRRRGAERTMAHQAGIEQRSNSRRRDPAAELSRPAAGDRDRAARVPDAVVAGDVRARAVQAVGDLPGGAVARKRSWGT